MANNNLTPKMNRIGKVLDKLGYSYTRYNQNHSFRVLDPHTGRTFMALMPSQGTDMIMQNGNRITLEQLEKELASYSMLAPAYAE